MKYSNLTNKSNIFLKRFTHSSRHLKCSKIIESLNYVNFLDFGSGDGQLFEYMKKNKNKNYYAYEPYKQMYEQFLKNKNATKNIKIIKNKKNLKKNFYDIITINEVFEHLPNKKILEVIKLLKLISKKKSTIIISVPLEVGLSSLLKNLIRIASNSAHEGLTFKNIFKSCFYQKINRGSRVYYNSHMGFNHQDLKKILADNFNLTNTTYSPFNLLKSILNSQVFYICKI